MFYGLREAVSYEADMKKLGLTKGIAGKTMVVQGLGNVGSYLIEHLFWAGAELILADKDQAKLEMFAAKYAAKTVPADQIWKVECEIFAPCALGGIINDQTIPQLRCRAVAGSANNQLLRDSSSMPAGFSTWRLNWKIAAMCRPPPATKSTTSTTPFSRSMRFPRRTGSRPITPRSLWPTTGSSMASGKG